MRLNGSMQLRIEKATLYITENFREDGCDDLCHDHPPFHKKHFELKKQDSYFNIRILLFIYIFDKYVHYLQPLESYPSPDKILKFPCLLTQGNLGGLSSHRINVVPDPEVQE